jgi:hypothetical protein
VKKKLSKWLVVSAIAATLIIPTMVFANKNVEVSPLGAEDWVGLLNSEYGVYSSRWVTTRPVNSDGGYIKVCMSGVNVGNTITVNVYEKDVTFKDTVKKNITFKGPKTGSSTKTCSENIDVEKDVDGNFAEFF